MAFTYVITTDLGKLRFRISDTSEESYAFTDAELNEHLTSEGSVLSAAVVCLDALIMDRARRARLFSDERGSVDETATLQHLTAMRDKYAEQAGTTQRTTRVRRMRNPPWSPAFTDYNT